MICGIFTFSAIIATQLKASTVVIDSFTEAGFELAGGPGGHFKTYSPILSPIVGSRDVIVRGSGGWTSTLHPSDGFLRYDVSTSLVAPDGQLMRLTYFGKAGEGINLLGQNAFLLTFSNLTGQGDLWIAANGRVNKLRLTGPGQVLLKYSELPKDLNLKGIEINFIPTIADFSFNLDEIAVVPEPGSGACIGAALFGLAVRRRRS